MDDWTVPRPVSVQPRSFIPLSFSSYARARLCNLSVAFGKDPNFPARMGPKARMGVAYHAALASIRQLCPGGEDAIIEFFRRMLVQQRDLAKANVREARLAWPKDLRESMELSLIIRCSGLAASRSGDAHVAIEGTLTSRDGLLVGRPDEVVSTDAGACIIDYKSGRADVSNLLELEDQVHFYAGLWRDAFGTTPSQARIEFLVDRTHVEVAISPDKVERLMAEAAALARELEQDSQPTARVGEHCRLCDYRPWCDAYWEHRSELDPVGRSDIEGVLCSAHPRDSKALCIDMGGSHVRIVNRDRTPLPGWPTGTRLRTLDLAGEGATRFRTQWTELFRVTPSSI